MAWSWEIAYIFISEDMKLIIEAKARINEASYCSKYIRQK
jgi:hypothetical protein